MFCKSCGKEIGDRALSCPLCGEPTHNVTVSNYLAQAILVTICCCLPFGIPAIIYAAQVNSKLVSGDVEGAYRDSASARMWCWIAFGAGLVGSILYGFLVGFGAVVGA